MGNGDFDCDEDRLCGADACHEWVKKTEIDRGVRAGVPTDVAEKLRAMERENCELRQANEILHKASAYFLVAKLDPPVQTMIASTSLLGASSFFSVLRRPIESTIHRRGQWRNFEGVEYTTLEWVDWFNHRRLLEPRSATANGEARTKISARLDLVTAALEESPLLAAGRFILADISVGMRLFF